MEKLGSRLGWATSHTVVWLYALVLATPLYYLTVTSWKGNIDIFSNPFSLPARWLWDNYTTAFEQAALGSALTNSLLVAGASVLLSLLLAIPAAYALTRSSGLVSRLVERGFALGFLIPGFAALVPTVLLAIELGLFHTRTFLVLFLPATSLPLSVILLTQFMRTIPLELAESAAVDGAGERTILTKIYLPLAMPGVASVTILNFLGFWNEFLFSLTILGPARDIRTIQVALPTLVSETATQYGVLAAGTVISLIPVYIAYILLQKRMQEALTAGAVKG